MGRMATLVTDMHAVHMGNHGLELNACYAVRASHRVVHSSPLLAGGRILEARVSLEDAAEGQSA